MATEFKRKYFESVTGNLAEGSVTPQFAVLQPTKKTIIKNIHCTNVSAVNEGDVSIRVNKAANTGFYYISKNSTVPLQSSFQPIEGFMVLESGDALEVATTSARTAVGGDTTGCLDVHVSYAENTFLGESSVFKHTITGTLASDGIGVGQNLVWESPKDAMVKTMHIANVSDYDSSIDLRILNGIDSSLGYIAKDTLVPTQAAYTPIDSAFIFESGDKLEARTNGLSHTGAGNTTGAMDVFISYVNTNTL